VRSRIRRSPLTPLKAKRLKHAIHHLHVRGSEGPQILRRQVEPANQFLCESLEFRKGKPQRSTGVSFNITQDPVVSPNRLESIKYGCEWDQNPTDKLASHESAYHL